MATRKIQSRASLGDLTPTALTPVVSTPATASSPQARVAVRLGAMLRSSVSQLFFIAALSHPLFGQSPQEVGAPFGSTWKLLNQQEKRQFVSGYLAGLKDAERITGIALSFIKENPQQAVKGLERVQGLFGVGSLPADTVAAALDRYFSEPANASASLTLAMSAARSVVAP